MYIEIDRTIDEAKKESLLSSIKKYHLEIYTGLNDEIGELAGDDL